MCQYLGFGASSKPGSAGREADGTDGGFPPILNAICAPGQFALAVGVLADYLINMGESTECQPRISGPFGAARYREEMAKIATILTNSAALTASRKGILRRKVVMFKLSLPISTHVAFCLTVASTCCNLTRTPILHV